MLSLVKEKTRGTESATLCVDLDGTLVATDMLWESVLLLIKQNPVILFVLPLWLIQGRAVFKRQVAKRVKIHASSLPYNQQVVAYLVEERKKGRKIVLATASDRDLVEPIVNHLGIFDEVVASDGAVNLKSASKRKILEDRFGYRQFDYVGNSAADLAVWKSARFALLVDPPRGTLRQARRISSVAHVFQRRSSSIGGLLKVLRFHQWSKNLLLFVPLITAHRIFEFQSIFQVLYGFAAMSLCASSIYIVNDLLDIDADRAHPRKRLRPFAAGTLSIPVGIVFVFLLSVSGIALGFVLLPPLFTALLLGYLAVTVSYSLLLKHKVVADVITLALLYTLRILIGGAAVSITISPWLLGFSVFLFMSLAFVKRYGEIDVLKKSAVEEIPGRAYFIEDKEWMRSTGTTSGYLAILVLALYISSNEVSSLYHYPHLLWLACPPLLYWISRIWLLAARAKVDDDPLVFAMKDRVSYGVAILVTLALTLAL